jgi:hypothetical protein
MNKSKPPLISVVVLTELCSCNDNDDALSGDSFVPALYHRVVSPPPVPGKVDGGGAHDRADADAGVGGRAGNGTQGTVGQCANTNASNAANRIVGGKNDIDDDDVDSASKHSGRVMLASTTFDAGSLEDAQFGQAYVPIALNVFNKNFELPADVQGGTAADAKRCNTSAEQRLMSALPVRVYKRCLLPFATLEALRCEHLLARAKESVVYANAFDAGVFCKWWKARTKGQKYVCAEQVAREMLKLDMNVLSDTARRRRIISMSQQHQCCNGCGRPPPLKSDTKRPFDICGGCRTFVYCSRQCHRKAWEHHKIACMHIRDSFSADEVLHIKVLYMQQAYCVIHILCLSFLCVVLCKM